MLIDCLSNHLDLKQILLFYLLCFSFKDLVDLLHHNDSALFESRSELMMALKYLHQTGFLLHFDDPRSRLQDYFFIRPAWLCKLLAQVSVAVTFACDELLKL